MSHPTFDCRLGKLLFIGCGDGSEMEAHTYRYALSRQGVEPYAADEISHRNGNRISRQAIESMQLAETFTHAIARVSLPYTDIPVALEKIRSVLEPGGKPYLMMHDWRMQARWLWIAAKGGHWKRVLDCLFVFAASGIYALTGKCIKKPWNGRRETFQTQARLRQQLWEAGFVITRMERTRCLEIEAIKR